MISLFIDTSLEDVSIALVKEGKELSQIHEYIPGKHSIYVTKYISDILKNNNLSPDNVDEIIVVNGPGSFTGIRIGVTIAKMFAYIKKIRIFQPYSYYIIDYKVAKNILFYFIKKI